MGLLDSLADGAGNVGKGILGLLGGAAGGLGEIATAAYLPNVYQDRMNHRNYERDQNAREKWAANMPMQAPAQNMAPNAFNNEEAQVAQMLDPNYQVFQPGRAAPTGTEMQQYMSTSPDAAGRVAAGKLATDRYAPRAPQKRQLVTAGDGSGMSQIYEVPQSGPAFPLQGVNPFIKSPMVSNVIGGGDGYKMPRDMMRGPDGLPVPIPNGPLDNNGWFVEQQHSEKYRKEALPFNDALSMLDNYAEVQARIGNVTNPYSAEGQELSQAHTQVTMALKEAMRLGVLDRVDKALMDEIVPPGTGTVNSVILGSKRGANLIRRARQGIITRRNNLYDVYPYSREAKEYKKTKNIKPGTKSVGDMSDEELLEERG